MEYTKQVWRNGDPTTPLSAQRLNHIESGIEGAHEKHRDLPDVSQEASPDTLVQRRGDGAVTLPSNPKYGTDAAPKGYVDRVVLGSGDFVSVVSLGAEPYPSNATQAFVSAIEQAGSEGLPVYVPAGMWMVDPGAIDLGEDMKLFGAGSLFTTLIPSVEHEGEGVRLGSRSELSDLYIRDFGTAVVTDGHWIKVYNNRMSYNTVGLHAESLSYICKVYDNEITFNWGVGVAIGGESYQFDLHHNIIDNNGGIGVAVYSSSGGVVISSNTIEGNRDFETGFGCGIYYEGSNVSRLRIENNWFEANGETSDSTDVVFSSSSLAAYSGIGERVALELVPEVLSELFDGRQNGTGAISIVGNAFIFTRNGVSLSMGSHSVASIKENSFKGLLDSMNRHILLNFDPTSIDPKHTVIDIENNGYNNTDNSAGINPQVETGIGGGIVHAEFEAPEAENIFYNKRPLFQQS